MADFNIAFNRTSAFEGFYAKDKSDAGGETLYGISRKKGARFPEFWLIVDGYKELPNFPHNMKADNKLKPMAKIWYKKNYWDTFRGDEINSQKISNIIYDISVNKGSGRGCFFANKLVGEEGTVIKDITIIKLNDVQNKNYYGIAY